MKRLLLSVLLFPAMQAWADPAEIQCPGRTTIEMRWCASKQLEESNDALQDKLPPGVLESWNKAKHQVCAAAYASFRQGSIYPQMVVSCDDRLNRTLLEEFTRLGE